jgi:hypothetical protein
MCIWGVGRISVCFSCLIFQMYHSPYHTWSLQYVLKPWNVQLTYDSCNRRMIFSAGSNPCHTSVARAKAPVGAEAVYVTMGCCCMSSQSCDWLPRPSPRVRRCGPWQVQVHDDLHRQNRVNLESLCFHSVGAVEVDTCQSWTQTPHVV